MLGVLLRGKGLSEKDLFFPFNCRDLPFLAVFLDLDCWGVGWVSGPREP